MEDLKVALDARKLLERLSESNRNVEQDVDVTFTFSHDDFDFLMPLAEEIGNLFADKLDVEYDSVVIGYDEHPIVEGAGGKQEKRPPQFTLTFVGRLTAEQFALLHELAARQAKQHEITYGGVNAWCE